MKKNPGDKLKKKSRFVVPKIFLRLESDLNLSRPWFSEIRVQIKRPRAPLPYYCRPYMQAAGPSCKQALNSLP